MVESRLFCFLATEIIVIENEVAHQLTSFSVSPLAEYFHTDSDVGVVIFSLIHVLMRLLETKLFVV